MKRTLSAFVAFASFLAATCYAQSAPGGVCISNVALTISNGYTAPVPFALATLCSAGSTQSTCTANKQPIFTSTALSTTTPTNPFQADVGGNYFFCASVGHYALMLAGSQGTYFVNDIALVDDWSKGGTVTGQWVMPSASITGLATSSPHCLQVGALGAVSATTFPCGNSYATGTVASVTVGTGWPSWFAPNISNPTTVPSINATVTAIPNSALANTSATINGTVCTLGAACTLGTNRTCNANGCYTIGADGTIDSWGTVAVPASYSPYNTASITFPHNFTTTPSVTIAGVGLPSSTDDSTTPAGIELQSRSTTGAIAYMARVIVAGAGGGNFTQTMYLDWHAKGY